MEESTNPCFESSSNDSNPNSNCGSPLSSHSSTYDDVKEVPSLSLSPMAWNGEDLKPKDYVFELRDHDVAAISEAVVHFKNIGVPAEKVGPETFPLPVELAPRLGNIASSLYNGIGVAVRRGIDPMMYNDFDKALVFAGVSSYVCSQRGTDDFASIIYTIVNIQLTVTQGHIRDATHDHVPEAAKGVGLAGSKIPVALSFHADRFAGDILALFVVDQGSEVGGGEQFLSSFWRIYQELLVTAPDVIKTLEAEARPWEIADPITHEAGVSFAPALFYAAEKPMMQLVHAVLTGGPQLPRPDHLPSLSAAQHHALRVLEKTAQKFSHKLDRQDGDIQFVNNLSIMHARAAYEGDELSSRHLLRMFLRDPKNAWHCSGKHREAFDKVFSPDRQQEFVVKDLDPWFKIQGKNGHG
ncbi:taurine catabolism dioxygenase TauD [Mollisia scopiformis]|uniref:Taurine catabolism dioxygenase TauD n=1 Tax=Mollisia scopiformis TaxID=149040 RepID=A0A194XX10_MOLSC|nr:taurine catabolism dioxygenase TauD [Mollisia scopiformis]KUJ24599.1 taurine catabolism dioxygenase TauD [Mollisia scopiformis]